MVSKVCSRSHGQPPSPRSRAIIATARARLAEAPANVSPLSISGTSGILNSLPDRDSISPMEPAPTHRKQKVWGTAILLALPYLGLCFPALYARATPALFGFPFFYWYQFAWVVLTSVLLYIVYRQLKSH